MKPPLVVKSVTERIAWHSFPLGDVFVHLNSKRDGLTTTEAKLRQKHFGLNALSPPPITPVWKVLLRHFLNPLNLALIFAGALAIFLGSRLDAGIILTLVLFNGFIGFTQERKAEKSLQGLKKLETEFALVVRDGSIKRISASEIVPGDVMVLNSGVKVSADARIIKNYGIRVDESILTGESKEAVKGMEAVSAAAGIFERSNVVFLGTTITDGSAEAVVFGTGDNSEIGRIGQSLTGSSRSQTIFEKRILKLSRFIGVTVLVLSVLIFVWGIIAGRNFNEMLLIAVAIAVAAVPEGLPVIVTVILVTGMKQVLKNKGLVRSLGAAETLGAVSIILADKTGTLTQGKMQVAQVLTPERRSGIFQMNDTAEYASNHMLMLSYGMLVSDVVVENIEDEISEWIIHARPVSQALFMAGIKAGLDWTQLNKKFRKVGEVSFNSARKYSASFRDNPEGELWVIAAGSPDVLLARVKKIQILNRFENALPSELAEIREAVDEMARAKMRVVAICSRKIEDRRHINFQTIPEAAVTDLNLVGLIGLKDPVRRDAREFLSIGRRAGIRTIMVTGDHSLTARAVALEVGLLPKNRSLSEVVEGKELDTLEPKDLAHKIRGVDIFSRVSPENKLRITEAWQSQGEVVAVIGDGVNDAPALRRADVGVALGSGVDLARESSDLILLDDSFATLVKAIEAGRVIAGNIKKVAVYLLSTSFSEIILVGLCLFFGLPLPLLASQILWVNLAHEFLPAMALAWDPSEKNEMDFPPDLPSQPLLDGFMRFLIVAVGLISALALFMIFYFFHKEFNDIGYSRTVVFAALGVLSLFSVFSIRGLRKPVWEISVRDNKYFLPALGVGLILMVAAIYAPFLQVLLRTQPLGIMEWLIFLGAGVLSVILVEAGKWIFIRRAGRDHKIK
ncbi:MAG: HAD-IC family P-type ATPase [Patescibacteria group bacterium]